MHRVGRALVVAVLLGGLSSCGEDSDGSGGSGGSDDPPDRSSRFAAELEGLPGVVDAEVEEEVVEGEGIEQLDVALVVGDDASEAEVAAALDAVADYDRDLGFDQHHSLVVERDGAEDYPLSHPLSYSHEPDETTAELVRRWVLAEDRLDPALSWTADGYGVVTVELGEDAGADDVTALAEEIGTDADLATLPRWTLTAEGDDARAYLSTEDGMTDAVVASWTTAVANLDLGPDGTSLTLTPQNSPGSYEADPPPAGSMRLDVGLELPGVVPPGSADPGQVGRSAVADAAGAARRRARPPALVPVRRRQLLPRGRRHRRCAGPVPLRRPPAKPATPEDPDRGWNAAAARYLAGG